MLPMAWIAGWKWDINPCRRGAMQVQKATVRSITYREHFFPLVIDTLRNIDNGLDMTSHTFFLVVVK